MRQSISSERNYGLDLLKVISMFFVVCLHVMNMGGILDSFPQQNASFWTAWFMEIAAYCAVDCFAMATGYLMAERTFRYRKILPMWLTVQFHSLVITIFLNRLHLEDISNLTWLSYLFPVTSSNYWYFTAYFGLFFFIPFANMLIASMSRKSFCILLLTGFFLFSVFGIVNFGDLSCSDSFMLSDGYSMWWLLYLYFLGAGIRKYNFFMSLNPAQAVAGYGCMVGLTWMSKFLIHQILARYDQYLPYSYYLSVYGENRFITYISPTILLSGLFLFIVCLKISIPQWLHKPLKWISPLLFQVYIIHFHPSVREMLYNRFSSFSTYSPIMLMACILVVSLGIFVGCICIDWFRQQLFRLLRMEQLVNFAADKVCEKTRGLFAVSEKI